MKVRNSLVGMTFGRLKVIKQVEDYVNPKGVHYAQYECECQCEERKHVVVGAQHLKNGHTQSCGCLNVESHIKHNKYDLSGEYGIGYSNNTNKKFYFDLEDYDKIKNYTWYFDKDGYVVSDTGRKHTKMHRLVTNAEYGCDVDHIGMEQTRNDNRKDNLRTCTRAENTRNKTKFSKNTSGCIGVCWHKQSKKWLARIYVNGEEINLGLFQSKQDAISARIDAEKKYFGDFAPQREVS